jgi:hypothetical protein
VADQLKLSLPNSAAHIVPPRYLEPEEHERVVANVIQSFLDQCVEAGTNRNPTMTGGPT